MVNVGRSTHTADRSQQPNYACCFFKKKGSHMLNNKERPVTKYRAWFITNDTSKNVKFRSTIDFTKNIF
jgi:hypothetical protein